MKEVQERYSERRDKLVKLLGVNPEWRMHKVSDGQRRRVQLFLNLLKPFKLLLLDEVTSDLDVVTRSDFLGFLKEVSAARLRRRAHRSPTRPAARRRARSAA